MTAPIQAVRRHEGVRLLVDGVVLAAIYVVTAKLGLRLAFANRNVTAVWPPTGVAVVALLVGGRRLWPGIWAGALIANLLNGVPPAVAAGISIGNTLAPVVAAGALRRLGFRRSLSRPSDVGALLLAGGFGSMLLSATAGTFMLASVNGLGPGGFWVTWFVWWIGDALGVILVAPLAFTLLALRASTFWRQPFQAAGFLAAIAAGMLFVTTSEPPMHFLAFIAVVVAALYFRQAGASAATFLVSGIAIWATINGHPFSFGLSLTENLVLLQVFNATLAATSLTLAAVMSQRLRAEAQAVQRAREREQVAEDHLRVLDESKSIFLQGVSHEMRTPLTLIIGIAQLLKNPTVLSDQETLPELLKSLDMSAHRLRTLLEDFLDLDRLERGVVKPNRHPTRLANLFATVMETLDLREHHVHVDAHEIEANVDPAQAERIAEHLVANAVKHTPPGTDIWLRAERVPGGVLIAVDDDGPGVSPEVKELLFKPFVKNAGEYVPGTGIGLALVDRFAKVHGGRAWIADRPGGGTSVRVFLPDAEGHLEARTPSDAA